MKVKIEYWSPKNESVITKDGFRYLDTKSVIKRIETWEGNKEEIFKKFDKENNSLKYCNGSYYKFEDVNLHTEYTNWYKSLSESTKFDMYYGNGIVA